MSDILLDTQIQPGIENQNFTLGIYVVHFYEYIWSLPVFSSLMNI